DESSHVVNKNNDNDAMMIHIMVKLGMNLKLGATKNNRWKKATIILFVLVAIATIGVVRSANIGFIIRSGVLDNNNP
ncbi:17549_t:CDS:2, partial [Gigaspora margarita]